MESSEMSEGRHRSLGVLFTLVLGVAVVSQQQMSWTQVATAGPSARYGHAMVYDSQRSRVVMFGGFDVSSGVAVGDTWEWDGVTWTHMGSAGPSARQSHAMAYDSQRGRTVLFGGFAGASYLADTWEWDGFNWLPQILASGPSVRSGHKMAYDAQRARVVMVGVPSPFNGYGDTWEWNGIVWLQAATNGPSPRSRSALAYSGSQGKVTLFGGYALGGSNTELGDTWEWSGYWSQRLVSGPSARSASGFADDSARGKTVLFGGVFFTNYNANYLGDTWEWNGSNWSQVAVAGPAARNGHAMAYDSRRGRTVLFGGSGSGGSFGDTWEFGQAPPVSVVATTSSFGFGCGSPSLALTGSGTARPVINSVAKANIDNIPTSMAFVSLGWSRTNFGFWALPVTLAAYGMPGCHLLQSCEAAFPVAATGSGSGIFGLNVPNQSGLLGLHVYLQAWAFAPGANLGNTVVSNGLDWGVGNL